MEPIAELPQDAELGEYRIEQVLRVGADAITYRARQPALDRAVALHVATAPGDSPEGQRFLERARALARVEHPHVLSVYDAGTAGGLAYAATRISAGEPVGNVGRLAREAAVATIEQAAEAVEALQRAGVIVSPSPQAVIVEGDRSAPLALVDPLAAPEGTKRSAVSGLGSLLAALAGPDEQRLMAVARRATDTTELASPSDVATAARAAILAQHPRRRALIVVVAIAAVAVAALVVLLASGGDKPSPPVARAANAMPARIAATIPIGSEAAMAAVSGRDVWILTVDNHLVHIDATTNRVVGAPLRFRHSSRGLSAVAGQGMLFVTDGDGTVSRLDPQSGRVLQRTNVGAVLGAAAVRPDGLWLTRSPREGSRTGHDVVMRLDLHTLRRIGRLVQVGLHPSDIEFAPGYADVIDTDGQTVTRVDIDTGRTRQVLIGPKPVDSAIAGGRLWVPDPFAAVLTGIDAQLARPPDIVVPVGPGARAITAAGALWVVVTKRPAVRSPARLLRVDPATGRVAGRALDLGGGVGWPAVGDGALWFPAQTRHAVLRVVPVTPAPPTHAVRAPAQGALRSGPATPGRKQTKVTGVALSVDVRSRGWVVAALSFVTDVRRFDNTDVGTAVVVPAHVFGRHGSTETVTSPEQLLSVLRRHTDLDVGPETRTTLGGLAARSVMLRARANAAREGFCPELCVPVYDRGDVTMFVSPAMRLTVVDVHGHTVAVSEDTPAPSSLSATGAVVRSLRFG